MPPKIWRGGMIGAGVWSTIQLNAWAGVKNAKIVALCDRHPDRRDPVVQQFNILQAYDDFQTMLAEADLDFVDICTRPYSHASLTRLAADRSLPVLCQKPFCTSLAEAQEVVEFCRRAGVRLMINENFRWKAWYRQAKELIDVGALGRPFCATIRWRERTTLPAFHHSQTYFTEMPRLILYELGVHYLDTFRYLFDQPESVYARQHQVSAEIKGEDVVLITLAYPELTGLIHLSWASVPVPNVDELEEAYEVTPPPRLEIDGTEGTLILKADGSMHLVTDTGQRQWRFSRNTRPAGRVAAQQHFVDCLESGAEFETSGAETLKTMELVYACYLSAEEGRVVNLRNYDES